MSSPSYGAMSPFMNRVHKLSQFVQHPLDSIMGTMPAPQQQSHDQAVQQMNQQANSHANDAANASFVHPAKIEDQKRPLKSK